MRLFVLAALATLTAGCARPDPLAVAHAASQQEASAMVGKDYVIVAPLLVCGDRSDVYDFHHMGKLYRLQQVISPKCLEVGAGRFRVMDAATLQNDGRTVLHIAGPGIDGYIPYESYFPLAYKEAGAYFGIR